MSVQTELYFKTRLSSRARTLKKLLYMQITLFLKKMGGLIQSFNLGPKTFECGSLEGPLLDDWHVYRFSHRLSKSFQKSVALTRKKKKTHKTYRFVKLRCEFCSLLGLMLLNAALSSHETPSLKSTRPCY